MKKRQRKLKEYESKCPEVQIFDREKLVEQLQILVKTYNDTTVHS